MNRTALATIALISFVATPLVVGATTPAPREPAAAPAAVVAAPEQEPTEARCAKRIKVVYQGYGEGAGSACALRTLPN